MNTTTKTARLGYIGVGSFISHNHLPNAHRSDVCHIRALCDIDADRLRERGELYQPDYTTDDYRRLLDDDDVDIVIIGTKQDMHAKLACAALEAGKWVLVEKPVGETLAEMEQVVTAAASAPGRLAVGHNRRFAPAVVEAAALMQPLAGPWLIYHRVVNTSLDKAQGFYGDRAKLVYEGCHMFDLANHFIGAYPTAVIASGDGLRNDCVVCEYADGSRFVFLEGSMGSVQFEKESIELFREHSSIHLRDYTDMRVRGFRGEFDRIHAAKPGMPDAFVQDAAKYGNDYVDATRANLAGDAFALDSGDEGWGKLPREEVRRVGMSMEAVDASKRLREQVMQSSMPPSMVWMANKGWYGSLEHFATSFLQGSEPRNADALDATVGCLTALAALESIKSGRKIALRDMPGVTDRLDLSRTVRR